MVARARHVRSEKIPRYDVTDTMMMVVMMVVMMVMVLMIVRW